MKIKDILNLTESVVEFPKQSKAIEKLTSSIKSFIDSKTASILNNLKIDNFQSKDELKSVAESLMVEITIQILKTLENPDTHQVERVTNLVSKNFVKITGKKPYDYTIDQLSKYLKTNETKNRNFDRVLKEASNQYPVYRKDNKGNYNRQNRNKQQNSGFPTALVTAGLIGLGLYAQHGTVSVPQTPKQPKPEISKHYISQADTTVDRDTGGEVKLYYKDGSEVDTEKKKEKNNQEALKDYKPFYKVGSPYTIKGKTYYPKFEPSYNKTGIASWYGPGFDGKLTANHDIFDTNSMTAAHPTLPIPSVVWVKNLENGKMVKVTINDRGPYHPGRIIDLSKAAAEKLNITNKGTAEVQVYYDKKATENHLKDVGLYDQYKKVISSLDKSKIGK